ncbi:MAG: hypothetical protein GEV03_23185 [Streptosporangiales bacterium]|nr:hypothetical protein [Streptosporangiales bacterium]
MTVTTGAYRRGAPPGLLAALLFLLVAGLLGMHGFGSHVVGSHHGTAMSEAVTDGPAAAQLVDGGTEPAKSAVAGLCLAVLSALALLVALTGTLRGDETAPSPQVRRLPPPRPRGRDPDPPSLAQLSVLRR